MVDNEENSILIQIRGKLNEGKIKLWLEPYYSKNNMVESEMEKLANQLGKTINVPVEICLRTLIDLQTNAIEKINSRNEYEKTGIATFKVRNPNPKKHSLLIQMKLSNIGRDLQEEVAKELNTTVSRIKLISSGKLVESDRTLENQNIKNNQQIMALLVNVTEEEALTESRMLDRIKKIRLDAELLINSRQDSFMRMEDQAGNAINLPAHEKKSLMMALALHEKGKAALKKDNFSEALVLFLEADKDFSSCTADILQSVDNYALLNLDIVWCYLCLKSLTQLPDAEYRLKICEEKFKKSYGENMNRVARIKGTLENEKALLIRLHLLKSILLYHQNRRNEAIDMLRLAENELNSLKIDDISLTTLLDMGYNLTESRVALRSCNNNVQNAINYIIQRRETLKEARKKAKEEKELNRLVGINSPDDGWINPNALASLVNMGFPKELSALALKKTDNDVDLAVTMLHNQQNDLKSEISQNTQVSKDFLKQLTELGFNEEVASTALRNSFNNFDEAVDFLLQLQGSGNLDALLQNLPSTSAGRTVKKELNNFNDEHKAFERFAEDISKDEDSYLDLPLLQEENYINEYKTYLDMF